jgi:hypothetical protein
MANPNQTHTKRPDGCIITANIYIDPSNVHEWKEIIRPLIERLRKEPELLFIECSQNPQDPGHLRVVHGWTKGSEWVAQVRYYHISHSAVSKSLPYRPWGICTRLTAEELCV